MKLFTKLWKWFSTPGPRPSNQGAALAPPEAHIGCKIVYEGESPLEADLVFDHGLGGHLYNTWSKNGVFWPKDLLSRDVRNARIITFGYDSHIVGFFGPASQKQIRGHAKTLIADLRKCRGKEEENTRPIVFIAHSVGGVMVKDALEFAKQAAKDQPQDGMIFLSTYGVVFLGTPYRGSHQAGWGIIAANVCRAMLQDADTGILQLLKQDSEILDRIREAFERIMTHEKVKAYPFVEKIPTPGIGMIEDFCRQQARVVVEKYWGHIGNVLEGRGYIHATQQEMSKFDSALDTGYMRVVDVIEDFVVEAAEAVESKKLLRSVSATS